MTQLIIEIEAPEMFMLEKRLDLAGPLLDVEAMRALEKATLAAQRSIERYTPVVTGRLVASIHPVITPNVGRVVTHVDYAPYVELGRGPAAARTRRTLRFTINGRVLFRRHVRSAEGRHMFRYGLNRAMPRIRDAFLDAAKAVTRQIAGK